MPILGGMVLGAILAWLGHAWWKSLDKGGPGPLLYRHKTDGRRFRYEGLADPLAGGQRLFILLSLDERTPEGN